MSARKPRLLVIGPTPPPYHGMAIFTEMLLSSTVLASTYEIAHLDTADRRSIENMGRLDVMNVWLALRHAHELRRMIRRHRPDVVLVQISQNGLAYLRDALFITLAKVAGCRVVTHLNGGYFREFWERTNGPCRWLVRRTSALVDVAAVLGEGLRPIYRGLVPEERVHVVPNGVAAPQIAIRSDLLGPEQGGERPLKVTYLGMLVQSKGYLELISAARTLRDDPLAFRFRFAGPWGSAAEEAAGRRAAEGLDHELRFVGVVADAVKWKLLGDTDVLALPSWYPFEGQPLVILEAMAAGVPVVATARAAIPDMVVNGETGILIPERDPGALVSALRWLAQHPVERVQMGHAARQRYLDHFTAERCAGRLVSVLDAARGRHAVAA